MIIAEDLIKELKNININFFCGVPDSLMSEFSKSLHFDFNDENHLIATNEGTALGICVGHSLSSKGFPLIYMQNSGLGNFINPYVSLVHSEIYNTPFVMLVGWRGDPSIHDEPQHKFQGRITLDLLEILEIKYIIVDCNSEINLLIKEITNALSKNQSIALVIKKDTFAKDKRRFKNIEELPTRKKALKSVLELFNQDTVFISTTGKLSRELYEYRKESNQPTKDFYTIGGMGHSSAIALGIAKNIGNKKIVCLDGDGSVLMHTGTLGMIGSEGLKNFIHIVFNNSAHESVGGQPNIYNEINREKLFESMNYKDALFINDLDKLHQINIKDRQGPLYIEIKVQNKSSDNLLRPEESPKEYLEFFKEQFSI